MSSCQLLQQLQDFERRELRSSGSSFVIVEGRQPSCEAVSSNEREAAVLVGAITDEYIIGVVDSVDEMTLQ